MTGMDNINKEAKCLQFAIKRMEAARAMENGRSYAFETCLCIYKE